MLSLSFFRDLPIGLVEILVLRKFLQLDKSLLAAMTAPR
jgi:hypothetical protein